MFALILSLINDKNKVRVLRRNVYVMMCFSILYYLTFYASKYLQNNMKLSTLNVDIDDSEFNIWRCLRFSILSQSGIGYGYPYGKNSLHFLVNFVHVVVIFILTMGLV